MSAFSPKNLINNTRFYFLVTVVLASIMIALVLEMIVPSHRLYFIRLQQFYGFTAIALWYVALLASPLKTIFGKEGKMGQYLYLRRAIGVSVAYFAFLHVVISFFKQLGGFDGVGLYPDKFANSLTMGLIGMLFLLIMAFTSFDKVVNYLTFKRWKLLHQFGYFAAILVFLHVWTVGTHLEYPWVKISLFSLLLVFSCLESWRITVYANKLSGGLDKGSKVALYLSMLAAFIALIVILPSLTGSYHGEHTL